MSESSHAHTDPWDLAAPASLAPPFRHEGVRIRVFWLRADAAKLRALVDARWSRRTGGAVAPEALGEGVAVSFTEVAAVRSLDPRCASLPPCPESEVAVWIPVRHEGAVRWTVPWIWVDEELALHLGRDLYGFDKWLGRVTFPRDARAAHRLDAQTSLGGPEARGATLEVVPTDRPVGALRSLRSLAALSGTDRPARWLRDGAAALDVSLLLRRELPAAQGTEALVEVLHAPLRGFNFRGGRLLTEGYALRAAGTRGWPLAEALGLRPEGNPVAAAFEARFDFDLDVPRRVWRSGLAAPRREKIAVLGGGVGALSAVWALTRDPSWRDRYEITVYQQGWKLGGKAASTRNPARGDRIEEHGLHVWFGFYHEAFAMLRAVYAELDRPASHPLARWEQAFAPSGLVELHDPAPGAPHGRWTLRFPPNGRTPGTGALGTPAAWVQALGRWALTAARMALLTADGERTPQAVATRAAVATAGALGRLLDGVVGPSVEGLREASPALAGRAEALRTALRDLARAWLTADVTRHRAWVPVDLALTALLGIARDDLLRRGFSAVDDEDLRAWLRRHGASRAALDAAPLRGAYVPGFAYEDGDVERPACAAGALLAALLRLLFAYEGAYQWRMTQGMGEAVVAPMYEALRRRGVRFAFFHRVDALHLSDDRARVGAITLGRQAVPKPEWSPLRDVGGVATWTHEPDWDALEDGERLRTRGAASLMSNLAPGPAEPVVLREGVDFDRVVLGIPLAVLPRIAGELIEALPAWRAMITHGRTCATVNAQVWLRIPTTALGWTSAARRGEQTLYGGWHDPVDTWAEMTHLGAAERWGADGPRSLHYFCGPWRESSDDADAQQRAFRECFARFLDAGAGGLWPATRGPAGFRWEILHDPEGRAGEARLDAQVVRVNLEPSDRYTLTPPGSTRHRLAPGASGLANLALCGDWTDNGVNLGCIEAAVASGLQASRAISAPSPRRSHVGRNSAM